MPDRIGYTQGSQNCQFSLLSVHLLLILLLATLLVHSTSFHAVFLAVFSMSTQAFIDFIFIIFRAAYQELQIQMAPKARVTQTVQEALFLSLVRAQVEVSSSTKSPHNLKPRDLSQRSSTQRQVLPVLPSTMLVCLSIIMATRRA